MATIACSVDGLAFEVKASYRFGWKDHDQNKLDDSMVLDGLTERVQDMTKDCHKKFISAMDHIKTLGSAKIDCKCIARHYEESIVIDVKFTSKPVLLHLELSRKKDFQIPVEQDVKKTNVPALVGTPPAAVCSVSSVDFRPTCCF